MDQTDEARLTREAGDTSVGFNLAGRVTSGESRMIREESMESIYQQLQLEGVHDTTL
jgi:hypothetical protein